MGIPVGTVKSRTFRAHRRLRVVLAHLLTTDVAG
jgi:DNA-directed RNA polymerase specialized sigma24 family protein